MFVLPKPAELENCPTKAPELIIRLTIFGFSRLYPSYQLQAMEKIRRSTYHDVVFEPLSGESAEDCRLRTFMKLYEGSSGGYERVNLFPFTVVDMIKQQIKDTHGVSSEHRLHFTESFLGLSVIWFKGQTVDVQRLVIEELSDIVEGSITDDEKLNNESQEEFNLRIFTELCKNVDFLTQVRFLEFVEQKRPNNLTYLWHEKLLIKPQDSHSAAELLSHLLIFGFSLLSADDQQRKIQTISTKVDQHEGARAILERHEEESEEDFRMKTFIELINKAPAGTRFDLFWELVQQFFRQKFRHPCLPIEFLRQRKLIQNLSTAHPCGPDQAEAQKSDKKGIGQATEDEEMMPQTRQSRYPEFLFGVSVLWFKTRCANSPKKPIHVLLGLVELGDGMKKLPDETGEDYRVRRFGEWFKQLPFKSQQRFVKYIRGTIFHDVSNANETSSSSLFRGYPYRIINPLKDYRHKCRVPSNSDTYYPQFIKVKNPNVKVLAGGGGGTTQGGGGGGGGGGANTQGLAWDDWMED